MGEAQPGVQHKREKIGGYIIWKGEMIRHKKTKNSPSGPYKTSSMW